MTLFSIMYVYELIWTYKLTSIIKIKTYQNYGIYMEVYQMHAHENCFLLLHWLQQ